MMQNDSMADAKLLSQYACCQVWIRFDTGLQMFIVNANAYGSAICWVILGIELAMLKTIVGRANINYFFSKCLIDTT